MYTPRAIFSRLFLQICPFVLSLYTFDRQVTLSCKMSDQSPITCVNGHYSQRAKYGLSIYITWIWKCGWKIWPCEFTKWRPDTTGNGAVRSTVPENPTLEARTKHDGNRMTRCRVKAIWSLPICVNGSWGRSVVGRSSVVGHQYSYFLHWSHSHILLFRYIRNVACEE